MIRQDYPIVKPAPIYLADPQPARRRMLIIAKTLGILATPALWALLHYAPSSDAGAVLAAFGCAGLFALVYRPTRVPTTSRVYTVWGMRLRGDVETDRWFDERRR